MSVAGQLLAVVAFACVAGAAIADIRRFEIPDGWSIAVAALFVVFAAVELPPGDWWRHAAAGAATFTVAVLLFARGWLGGGDVKLVAAVACWTGFAGLPMMLLGTVFTGGGLALAAVCARRLLPQSTYPALQADGPLPYAVAILGGTALFATLAV